MKAIFRLFFKYNKFKLVLALLILPLSVAVYNMSSYVAKEEMFNAIDNYINIVKNDFGDREYRALKDGRNLDAMKKLNAGHGYLKHYGSNYMVMSFNNRGARYQFTFYHQGGEKRMGLKMTALDHIVEDIFEDGGYNIRIKTEDCKSTAFFSASKPCIDQTYKIY